MVFGIVHSGRRQRRRCHHSFRQELAIRVRLAARQWRGSFGNRLGTNWFQTSKKAAHRDSVALCCYQFLDNAVLEDLNLHIGFLGFDFYDDVATVYFVSR